MVENKIGIVYLSHGSEDLKDLELSSQFINRTNFFKKNSDVFVHNDNDELDNETLLKSINYHNFKELLRTPQTLPVKPSGWMCGWAIGLSKHFHKFLKYDLIISKTCDVYLVDESELEKLVIEELESDNLFTVCSDLSFTGKETQYYLDFFMFKPKKIKNIFSDINIDNPIDNPMVPETWFFNKLNSENYKLRKIDRGIETLDRKIDKLNLIHCHHAWVAESILNGIIPTYWPY
jgi:hypothetical protein